MKFFLPFFISLAFAQEPQPTPLTVQDYISVYSFVYKVDRSTLIRIIQCESNFDATAHNKTNKEDSWGLVQINLLAHSEISKEEAIDSQFSIRYLASEIAKGHGNAWSCW